MEAPTILHRIPDYKAAFGRPIVSPGSASAPAWMEDRQADFNIWAASFNIRSSSESSLDHRVRDKNNASKKLVSALLKIFVAMLNLKLVYQGFIEVENQEVSVRKPNYPDIREDSGSEASDSEVTTSSEPAEDDSLETLYEEQKCYIHKILKLLQRDSIATRK
ncbi:uncharacterized protein BDZ83DRAFT_655931 [Colletotrichum acutatum]|uniref:Uncharacterized protein n=1 Tax=Glomerella acutata TaxID=27357 RepID=A0AAD8UEM9_GLOAC|nr:uncharacterized protein BDZ83DRAFT_655931 [Colletotrichum acutatum]KAK1714998.1 hypothetical protein BDZ83DRAFT_655931 [Colletotrichum acutatum]